MEAIKIIILTLCVLSDITYGQKKMSKKRIKTPKCRYTFVVNEFGADGCPNTLPQQHPADSQYQTSSYPESPLLPYKAPNNLPLQDSSELKSWLSNMERQLVQELKKSNDINTTLSQHQNTLSRTEKLLTDYEANFTTIFRMLRYLENSIQDQNSINANLDKKLSGVMLDMAEVNTVLTKKVATKDGNIQRKLIEVQSATEVSSCQKSPDTVVYRDCAEVQRRHNTSGVYYVTPTYAPCPVPVWCDMDTTLGGWLLILKRENGKVDFKRLWDDYKHGFGDVTTEFYLGNDNIFLLTNQKQYEVRFDLWDFSGNRVYALYKSFYINGERDNYKLHIHGYEGSARDSMKLHDRMMFSTPDRDYDNYRGYNCAREWAAGWWFTNCWFSFLTGPYYNISSVRYRGISWNDWKHEQLAKVEMKIRPSRLPPTDPELQSTSSTDTGNIYKANN